MPFAYFTQPGDRDPFNPRNLHVVADDSSPAYQYAGGNTGGPDFRPSFWSNGDMPPGVGIGGNPGGPPIVPVGYSGGGWVGTGGTAGQFPSMQPQAGMRGQSGMGAMLPSGVAPEPTLDPQTPSVSAQMMRQFGSSKVRPSWGTFGDPGQDGSSTPMLQMNGQTMVIPPGVDRDAWIQQQVGGAQGQPRSFDDRMKQLLTALDQRGLPFQTKDAIFKQFSGQSINDYADRNMKVAIEMQGQREAQMKEYHALALSAGGVPEDIIATFGTNPAGKDHANEYLNSGRMLPPDQFGEERQVPPGWRKIDPGTVDRMRQIRTALNIGTQPQYDATKAAADIARGQHLQAKAQQGAGPQAQPEGPPAPSLPAGLRARQAISGGIPAIAQAINGRIDNYDTGALNGVGSAYNFLAQLFSGSQGSDVSPLPTAYDSKNPGPASWSDVARVPLNLTPYPLVRPLLR